MLTRERTDIAVIGAGVIGLTIALELVEAGHEVVLVDPGDPGMGASYGNAGTIADLCGQPGRHAGGAAVAAVADVQPDLAAGDPAPRLAQPDPLASAVPPAVAARSVGPERAGARHPSARRGRTVG